MTFPHSRLRNPSVKYDPTVFRNSPLRECITFSPEAESESLPPSSSSINVSGIQSASGIVTSLDTSSCSISKIIHLNQSNTYDNNNQFNNRLIPIDCQNYQSGGWEHYSGSKHYEDEDEDEEYSSDEEQTAINNINLQMPWSKIYSSASFNISSTKLFNRNSGNKSPSVSQAALNRRDVRASSSSMSLNLTEMMRVAAEQIKHFTIKKPETSPKPFSVIHANNSTMNLSAIRTFEAGMTNPMDGDPVPSPSDGSESIQGRLSSSSIIQLPPQSARSSHSRKFYSVSDVNISHLLMAKSEIHQPHTTEKDPLTARSQPDLLSQPTSHKVMEWFRGKMPRTSISGLYRKRTSSVGLNIGDAKSKSAIGSIEHLNIFHLERQTNNDVEKGFGFNEKVGSFADFLKDLKPAKFSLLSKTQLNGSPEPIILTKEHAMFSQNDLSFEEDQKELIFDPRLSGPTKWYQWRHWMKGDQRTERLYIAIFAIGFLFYPLWLFAYIAICLLPLQTSRTPNPIHTRWKSRFRLGFTIALWLSLLLALILVITHPNWFPKRNRIGAFGEVSTLNWDNNALKDKMVVGDQVIQINRYP